VDIPIGAHKGESSMEVEKPNAETVVNTEVESGNQPFEDAFAEATGETSPVIVSVKSTLETESGKEKPVDAVVVEDQPVVIKPTEETDYKNLFEREQQRTKSWEGRLSATEKRNNELAAELEGIKKKGAAVPDTSSVSLVDDDDPLIKSFKEEMGDDFMKPLEAYVKRRIDAAIKPFADKVPAIETRVASIDQSKVDDHYGQILAKHSDVPDLLKNGELDVYVESLPYKDAVEKKKIMEHGTTRQVISFLDEFKEKTGKVKKPDTSTDTTTVKVSDEEIAAATAVKGKGSAVPKSKPQAQDFEGAFAEATAS